MRFLDSPQWLLVTDVDDTLAGDWCSLREFSEVSDSLLVVLNSSRPRTSLAATLSAFPPSLRIDGIVSALGTEIEVGGIPCCEWSDRFAAWDRSVVDGIMARAGCAPHPPEMQTKHKASFSVPKSLWPKLRESIRHDAPGSRVITSGVSDFDVIPAAAGKGAAALEVVRLLGMSRDRMIVAGDSGNDLAMFHVADRAIAVGNARCELIAGADPSRTYFARAPRASGILEGLLHWGALRPAPHTYG